MRCGKSAAALYLDRLARDAAVDLAVEANDEGVAIRLSQPPLQFHHSFVSGPLARRASQPGQALLRACNNKQRGIRRILDITAGWGADGLILASRGQEVTLVEQNALLCAITAYSLARLAETASGAATAGRISIENASARDYLHALDDDHEFDCIYLDPMFPAHKSSAKPAKEMQILQCLTDNLDIETCFGLALQKARRRIVVKRPLKAPALDARKPDIVYREKTIRFDVYLAG